MSATPARQPAPAVDNPVDRFLRHLSADPVLSRRLVRLQQQPGRPAAMADLPAWMPLPLQAVLRAEGKSSLYAHQRQALDLLHSGQNVVVATETSSGKSLCFQLPVLSSVLADPNARALFLFPTNPLANDQENALRRFVDRLPPAVRPRGLVKLQGGMGAQKRELAQSDPQLVLSNPEMVHLHLLPQHRLWSRFWSGLKHIVVDEVHLYRGAFGGHMAQLLRRVRRCAWRYGAKPVVVAASATVGNPQELAQELCAAPFTLVNQSGAPRGPRRTVLWRPEKTDTRGSWLDDAVLLFRKALSEKLQVILFARSRQMVETLTRMLEDATGLSRIKLGVRAYRGGYTRDEREVIEQGLRDGSVRGVVTTNALEVGIDIGSLDVCIMAGYPGSLMAMRQQAGRVGRRDQPSVTFLVASDNPLDAYLLQHPAMLDEAPSEQAVLGRLNPHVLRAHLACAAAEFPLWEAEIDRLGGDSGRLLVDEMVQQGRARWGREGARRVLYSEGYPHNSVSLRSASQERWQLVDPDGVEMGYLDASSVAREAYPGAIYLHQGRAFRVEQCEQGRVQLARAASGHSTKVQGDRTVTLQSATRTRGLPGADVLLAPVAVVDTYDRYLEMSSQRSPRARKIEPPVTGELRTEALVLRLSAATQTTLSARGAVLEEALHATEHLLAAFGASCVLCDRDDLEGHSGVFSGAACVVLFDRHAGGLGFAAAAFAQLEQVVARASEAVEACGCDSGCPACVHSGRCLRGNDQVSKAGARLLLRLVRGLPAGDLTVARKPAKTTSRRPLAEATANGSPGYEPRGPAKEPKDAAYRDSFNPGDRVEHAVYGEGTVVEVRPSGRVVVDFGDGRARRLTPGWLRVVR